MRRAAVASLLAATLCAAPVAAQASGSSARRATSSERRAVLATYAANDGGTHGVYAVYVSRSNSSLAVVCVRTPEAGKEAFLETKASHGSWRYLASGRAGRVGNSADRQLERAC